MIERRTVQQKGEHKVLRDKVRFAQMQASMRIYANHGVIQDFTTGMNEEKLS